jgi:4-hydroxybenzoate polyprenyltransferase
MRWWQFTKERFEPASHLTMIVVFPLVHILLARSVYNIQITTMPVLLLFVATTAFYFKLRLYDEVKDYELDVVINKTRPLPRGLLNHSDMYLGMIVCILTEAALFGTKGLNSLLSIFLTISYSLLMFKEFFIKEKIRPHLTTYAMLHTIVTSFLSIAIFSYLSNESFFKIIQTKECLSFALANWMLFNIFEFGRKTFAPSEERENIDTYSSLFGKWGAVLLVLSQATIAHLMILKISYIHNTFLEWSHALLFLALIIVSFQYIISDEIKKARNYRLMSSVYIIIFYFTLAIAFYI